MSIEKLKANYPVSIRWIHFPLHPDTPLEGKSLVELFAGRDIEPMRQRMKALMAEADLPYGDRTHTYNSRLAQELGKWADTQEDGEAIHDVLYRAYFVDNINLYDIDALVKLAENVALDGAAAREVLEKRSFQDAVDEDWQLAYAKGVTGVPTFHNNDLVVVGCQPYEVLERFVKHLLEEREKQSV